MYVCPECGSSDIIARAWIGLNTKKFDSWVPEDEEWCDNCQEHLMAIPLGEYKERQREQATSTDG